MTDFLHRQWVMLSLLPRSPRVVDTRTLQERLREQGVRANRRSIQRDLVALSGLFPIVCDERSKPYGWAWADEGTGPQGASLSIGSRLARAINQAVSTVGGGVVDTLVSALVEGRLCVIVRKDIRRSTQTVEPVAIAFRDRSPHLLCAIDGKLKQVPLRTISSAKLGAEGNGASKRVLDTLVERGARRRKTTNGRVAHRRGKRE